MSNDPNNPVWTNTNQPTNPPYNPYYKYDSGWSDVNDGKLQVTIHYEVVDLGANNGSPLSFRDANDQSAYVKSERYVILQTYVFKNISASDINNLEFYQMLHVHPVGIYNPTTLLSKCVYENTNFFDPLSNYTPYDPDHQVGNFKYDITIWNLETQYGEPNHIDWMSFSCTNPPDAFDCNTFTAQNIGMEKNIRNRNF